ncbi:serine hydrolase domain-containing protein [Algoriphagus halophytocola]|uniref:Beta-lactamase family protein n=1 Tax=Algoriphagus halophytocola TaxID=2991499 RepID=A0ABY6MLM7_9BACT|nr:serine hydrolase domain-containing protein [Algoriphagus sp. TR-M5]UZD23287.1 beta-lactamase family protein [Algoriphagus sp. TR-M5]
MKNKKRLINILIPSLSIIISSIFIPWLLLRAWLAPLPDTVQEQVDNALNYKLDGIIVYVDQGGKAPELYAEGWKNKENEVPMDPQALFKIASISKLYIAVAAAKLVANDRLSLDRSLASYLPDLKGRIENSEHITLRMLLRHRSGIPNFTDQEDFPWDNLPKDNQETLTFVLDRQADFSPDEKFAYSNTNYLLIGEILDKTLGYSHHGYIKKEILEPLNLHHTYSLLSEVDVKDLTSGYVIGYGPDVMSNDFTTPGGSMVSTAEETGVFIRALNDGTLLNQAEQDIYSSVYEYGHTGLLPGYQSIARYHPDLDAVVVQFVNTSGDLAWNVHEIVYNKVLKILRKNKP